MFLERETKINIVKNDLLRLEKDCKCDNNEELIKSVEELLEKFNSFSELYLNSVKENKNEE